MFGEHIINEKKSASAASLVTRMLIATVVLLFTMSLANTAMAEPKHLSIITVQGQVVGIDPISKTLTMKALKTGGQITFTLDKNTEVLSCNETKSFEDVNIGDEVTVTYHELESGKTVVDNVAFLHSPGIYALIGVYGNEC